MLHVAHFCRSNLMKRNSTRICSPKRDTLPVSPFLVSIYTCLAAGVEGCWAKAMSVFSNPVSYPSTRFIQSCHLMMSKLLSFSAPPGNQVARPVSYLLLSAVALLCSLSTVQRVSAQCTGNISITNNPINVPMIQVNCPPGPLMIGPPTYTLSFAVSVAQIAPGSVTLDFVSNATSFFVDAAPYDNPQNPQSAYTPGGNVTGVANGTLMYFTFPIGVAYNIVVSADNNPALGIQPGAPCPPLNIVPGLITPSGGLPGAVCFPNPPTGYPVPNLPNTPIYVCQADIATSVVITNTGIPSNPPAAPASLVWSIISPALPGYTSPVCGTVTSGQNTNSATLSFAGCAPGRYLVSFCETGGGVITASCVPVWAPQPLPCQVCDTVTVVILEDPDVTGVPADVNACNGAPVGPFNFSISGTASQQAATQISWTISNTLAVGNPLVNIGTPSTGVKVGSIGNEIDAFNALNATTDNINANVCVTAQRIQPNGTVCANLPPDANCLFDIFVCADPLLTKISPANPVTVCSTNPLVPPPTPLTIVVHSALFDGATVDPTNFTWEVIVNNANITGQTLGPIAVNGAVVDLSFMQTLTNLTTVPQTLTYRITAKNSNAACVACAVQILDIPVTVTPVIAVNPIAGNPFTFCPDDAVLIQLSTSPLGGRLSWTSSVVWSTDGNTGIYDPTLPILSEISTFAAPNATGNRIVSTITVVSDNAAPCADDTETFQVTICPRPALTITNNPPVCSGVSALTFTVRSNLNADQTAFSVASINNANITNEQTTVAEGLYTTTSGGRRTVVQSATGDEFTFTIPATQVVNTTNAPIVVNYTVITRNSDCNSCLSGLPGLCPDCESTITVPVTINPNNNVTPAPNAIFCSRNAGTAPSTAEIGPFPTLPAPNVAVNYTITGGTVNGFAITAAQAAAALGIPTTGVILAGGTRAITIPSNTNVFQSFYNFTLGAAGDCDNTTIPFQVIVRPEPAVTPVADQRICSGGSFPGLEIVINNRGGGIGAPGFNVSLLGPGCAASLYLPDVGYQTPAGFGTAEDGDNTAPLFDRPAAAGPYNNFTPNSQGRLFSYQVAGLAGAGGQCLSPVMEFQTIVDPQPVYNSGIRGVFCSGSRLSIPLAGFWNGTSIQANDFSWTAVAVPAGSVMGFTISQPFGVPTTVIDDELFVMAPGGTGSVVYTITPRALSADCAGAGTAAAPCLGVPFNVTVNVDNRNFKIPDILTPDGPYCVSDPCVDLLDESQVNLSTIAAALGPNVNWRWKVNDQVFIPGNANAPLYVSPGPAASHGGYDQGPSGAVFCPNIAGPGVHIICLEFFEDANADGIPDPGGCVTSDCRTFLVYPEFNPAPICPVAICVSTSPAALLTPVLAPDFDTRLITFGLAGGPATNPTVVMSQVLDPQGNVIENENFTTWSGYGVTNPFNSPNGLFNPAAAAAVALGNPLIEFFPEMLTDPIVVAVQYEVGYDQCRKYGNCNIEIMPTQVSVVNDLAFDCTVDPQGNFDLSSLLSSDQYNKPSTVGGTWTLATGPFAEITVSNLQYDAPGCYEVVYTVPINTYGGCPSVTDNGFIYIPEQPAPAFIIDELTICKNSADSEPITVQLTSPSYDSGTPDYLWTANADLGTGVIVELFDPTSGNPTILVTGTDAFGGNVEVCLTETFVNPACGPFPETTCSATTCRTIRVMPQPIIICPADLSVNNDVDKCGANVWWDLATASDDCGVVTPYPVSGGVPGTYYAVGTHTITYSSGDPTAPKAVPDNTTCSFTVTVIDMQNPHAVCRDQTVFLSALANGNATVSITPQQVDGGSSDNCGLLPQLNNAAGDPGDPVEGLQLSQYDFNCANKGQLVITLTATDVNNRVSTCNATITVVDNTKPTIDCIDFQVGNTPTKCFYRVVAAEFDPLFSDNCPGTTISNGYNFSPSLAGARFEYGVTAVVWTATDAAGNTKTCVSYVTVLPLNPQLTVTITEIAPVNCQGFLTGTLMATATPGTAPYTFRWTDNANTVTGPSASLTSTIMGLFAGTYLVVVTDADGCTASDSWVLYEPEGLNSTITTYVDVTCNGGNNGSATVTAVGGSNIPNPLYDYVWERLTVPGGIISTTMNSSLTTNTVTGLVAGLYRVTVTDELGCQSISLIEIEQPTRVVAEIVASTNVLCFGDFTGTATVNATGGTSPYTYDWSNDGPENPDNDPAAVTGLAVGTYTVTVTDSNGCTATASVTITQPAAIVIPALVVTNVLCRNAATGAIEVPIAPSVPALTGGVLPYHYLWSNGSTDRKVTGLVAGTYTVTVTDGNGCTATAAATVTQPATAVAVTLSNLVNPNCEGNTTGSARATASGGTGPYTFAWGPSQIPVLTVVTASPVSNASGFTAGTWFVTVTDANGCTAVASFVLVDPTGVLATITAKTDVLCNGAATGSATVTASGGTGTPPVYQYLWNTVPAQTNATATGLAAGFYCVTVSNPGGTTCTAVACVQILQPTKLIAEAINIQATTCNGSLNTGAGTVNATGGTTPYTYDWSNDGPENPDNDPATVTGLAAGTYTVTVTDANNCTATVNVVIPNGPFLAITEIADLGFVCANDNGRPGNPPIPGVGNDGDIVGPISLYATPLNPNIVYCWIGGAAAGLPNGCATGANPFIPAFQVADVPGTYTITITASLANGCVDFEEFSFTVLNGPSTPHPSDVDLFECETKAGVGSAYFIFEKAIPGIMAGIADPQFYNVTFYRTQLEAEEGIHRLQSPFFSFNGTSIYVRVENVFTGCYSTTWVKLNVLPAPVACAANLVACPFPQDFSQACFNLANFINGQPTTLYLQVLTCWPEPTTPPAAGLNITYHLSKTEALMGMNPITNICTASRDIWSRVTNAAGCVDVDVVHLEVLQSPSIVMVAQNTSCFGGRDGQVNATVVSGPAPYKFEWSTGKIQNFSASNTSQIGNKMTFEILLPGVYTVTVTDGHGCQSTASATVAEGMYLAITELPDLTVCPGSKVGPIELSSMPSGIKTDYNWSGGAALGLPDLLPPNTLWSADPEIPVFMPMTEGTWTVTVTAHYASCLDDETFTVTVIDNTAPVFIQCPGNMVANNEVDKCSAIVKWAEPLAIDNCQPNVVITQTAGSASGSVFQVSLTPYTITYVANDLYGNTAICQFTITVRDMQLPDVQCPGGTQTFGTNLGNCTWTVLASTLNATATDNCAVTSLTNNFTSTNTILNAVFPLGATTVIWTAADAAGNTRSCTYRVVVADDDIPTVTACPANIVRSNDLGICGAAVTYTVTFADNCGGTATQINGLASGSIFPVGITVVEWSYNDVASNGPVNCSFTVTVNDTELPKITCPTNVVVGIGGTVTGGPATLISSGPCGVTLQYTSPVGTDNCPGVVTALQSGLGAGPNFFEYGGLYTETYNVFDNAGNKATCSFSIEVRDPINPTITCPSDVTINTDIGECDAAVTYSFPYSGDNCPNYSLTKLVGPNSGEEFPLGITTVSFRVTDPSGNSVNCTFTVTVTDLERPFISICPAPVVATTSSNGTGDCSGAVPSMTGALTTTDNCGIMSVVQSPVAGASFGSAHGDIQIVTFTVTDNNGNTSTCQSTVRLSDNEVPSIVCTGLTTTFNVTVGFCGRLVVATDNVNPSFGDNCAGARRTHNFPTAPNNNTLEGAILPIGSTTVVWTITDINNNTTICAVTYTVTDNVAPVFLNCPSNTTITANIIVNNDVDKCGANIFWIAPVAFDACGVTVVQLAGPVPGSFFPVGTTTITYRATDPSGNVITCSWTFTVVDMQLPDIQCPSGLQYAATNLGNCTWTVPSNMIDATATDNCIVASLTNSFNGGSTLSGAVFPLGSTVVTWTARDGATPANSRTCTYRVIVQDLTDPTVQSCPLPIVVSNTAGICGAAVTYTVLFQDNCDGTGRTGTLIEGLLSGATFPVGVTTVIWRYFDMASNDFAECQFTVRVNDTQVPVIACPTNITVNTNGTISGGTGGSPAASPVITAFGPCGVNLRYTAPVGTDNCPIPQTDNISGLGVGPNFYAYNGIYTETWRVTDASGNSASCSFTITVLDPVTPTITCPSNVTVNNILGKCAAPVTYSFPYYSDNCPNYTLTQLAGLNSGAEFPVGVTNVSFRVTDNAGNSTVCSFSVTVLDREAPVITVCPADQIIPTSSNGTGDCSGAVPNLVALTTAIDNCTLASITQSPAPGTAFGAAHNDMIFVIITATDIYGNFSTCRVKLTLVDNEVPTINCANIPTALNNTPGFCHYFVPGFNLNPTFADNCGPLTLTNNLTGNNTLGGTPLAVGSTTVIWTVTDANGNSATCSATYVVTDNEPPVARCQGPFIDVVLDGDGLGQLRVADVNNDSWDNCGVLVRTQIKRTEGAQGTALGQNVYFSCADALNNSHPVVLEIEDLHGNISRCTTMVDVYDLESPVITCPNGVETVTDPALCTAIVNGIGLQYSHDNCATATTYTISGATIKTGITNASGTIFNKGFSTVTYVVVDSVGNSSTCSFDVEVEDAELPVINCSNITNIARPNALNQCGYTVNGTEFNPASFSDNCPDATISNNYNNSASLAGADFPVGLTTVIWTVTDASGNTITCISKVTISDTQIPTITCPTATATRFDNDFDQCSKTILTNVLNPGFSDNCPGAELSHNYVTAPNPWTLAGATFPVGSTVVTWVVTDKSGNSTSCSITVVVTDKQIPEFVNCPTEMVMVGNDVDKCSAKVNWAIPVAQDNCDILAVVQTTGPGNGSIIAVSPIPFTVTYRATDINGNFAICSFQVQVVDTQKPEYDADILMPADVTVQCDAVPLAFVLTNNDVNDNCTPSANLVITYNQVSTQGNNPALCSFYSYIITRTWTVTDAAGNARIHTQVITVVDTTKPLAKCKNATITLDKFGVASITGAGINDGSTDNCATNFLTFSVNPGTFGCLNLGVNTVILTVTDPCGNSSTCQATVTVLEGPGACTPVYDLANSVKCECLNNATNQDNGQFREVIQIRALAGQTWTVTANTGLYTSTSPAPPASPLLIALGTAMTPGSSDGIDNDKDGTTDEADEMIYYTLRGVHVDALGYNVTLKNVAGQALTITNKCYYPSPVFTNLNDPFCLTTPIFTIGVVDNFGGAGNVINVTVNGVATTTFNAATLGVGSHKVAATFDAGTATPFITVNGVTVSGSEEAAIKDPGCQQMIMQFVSVVGTPSQIVCNDLLYVSLDASCTFTIQPDDVMEGTYFCYDDYKVELDKLLPMGNGPWVPSVVGSADIGKTYQYRVTHVLGGNICWGSVTIEDKLPPVLTCPSDKQILCVQDEDNLALTGTPTFVDCSNVTLIREDDYVQYTCAQNNAVFTRVLRTWVATDAWGNSSTCLQIIDKLRGKISQVVFPSDKEYVCNNLPSSLEPPVTGWPTIGGVSLTTNGTGACGLSVNFTDEEAAVCPGSYKIIRTWKITDWCTANGQPQSVTYVQYIKVLDAPPTIDFSNFDYDADHDWYNVSAKSAFGGQCVASGPLPIAIINGVCNNVVQVKITTPVGNVNNGGLIPAPGLSIGQHPIKYFVEDECGNITSITIIVNVVDDVPPAVACLEVTQVAIGGNGKVLINATTFDKGTYDNCCLDYFEVARMNGDCNGQPDDFGPQVEFCCSDINDTITVVFRAWDCNKNSNDCMVQVYVEDKLKPICTSPANTTVTCENFDPSLWVYGFATAVDNCCIDTITTTTNFSQFDTLCNRGTITRTFRVLDCGGNTSICTQRIFVTYEQDYFVRFPDDRIISVCDGTGNYGEPTFLNKDCELLGVSFTDEVFTVVPDACYKIERTWHIINWCFYNANLPLTVVPNPSPNATVNAPANNPGPVVSSSSNPNVVPAPWTATRVALSPGAVITDFSSFWSLTTNGYSYKQIIKVIDTQDPVVENCPASPQTICDLTPNAGDLWNESYWYDNGTMSHNLCEAPTDLNITATDACSGAAINIRYLLFLDLDNNGSMETVISSTNLPGFNNVQFNNAGNPNFTGGTPSAFDERLVPSNQKYGFALQTTVVGNKKTAAVRWNTLQAQNTFVIPELPYGTHKIKWIVEDGCGNETVCEYTFIVKDCKAPTVVCINGLSVNIMPTGMIAMWASDFLQYTEDNCTPTSKLNIGIRRVGQADGQGNTTGFPRDAAGNPQTTVTFTCADLGQQEVELWSLDLAGNADFCQTYIIIQDNQGVCNPNLTTVAGVLATEENSGLEDANVELTSLVPTNNQTVISNDAGQYVFTGVPKSNDYTVTPVKDDNPLNGVSTYDLVLISKHILGLEPLTSEYKMIAADANKSGSITTFDIVEIRKLILGIYTDLPNNTSWRFVDKSFVFPEPSNPFKTPFPENKSLPALANPALAQDFVAVKVGDVNGSSVANSLASSEDRTAGTLLFDVQDRTVKAGEEFEVTFRAANKVQGYQFTLNLAGLAVAEIVKGDKVNEQNFGVFADALTVSVDGAQEFSVKFRATKSGKISQMLTVSGRITKAEAYTLSNERESVALRYNGSMIAGVGFELYQNEPNPFVNKTFVGFNLPEAATATLTIFDESGRTIFTQKGDYAKGYNKVAIERELIGTTGLLYYKLETATDSATKKMIQTK